MADESNTLSSKPEPIFKILAFVIAFLFAAFCAILKVSGISPLLSSYSLLYDNNMDATSSSIANDEISSFVFTSRPSFCNICMIFRDALTKSKDFSGFPLLICRTTVEQKSAICSVC